MPEEIIWEDPPEDALESGRRGRYQEFANALRAHPEKWAILPSNSKTPDSAKNTAINIRLGRVSGFAPKGAFETRTHGTKIYVRCVAGTVAEPEPEPERTTGLSQVEADHGRGAMIRSWARSQGIDVPDRGRLSQAIVSQYELAHGPR